MFLMDEERKITLTRGDSMCLMVDVRGVELAQGDVMRFTVKKKTGDSGAVIVRDVEMHNDRATIRLTDADSTKIAPGMYRWDVRLFAGSGETRMVITPFAPAEMEVLEAVGATENG